MAQLLDLGNLFFNIHQSTRLENTAQQIALLHNRSANEAKVLTRQLEDARRSMQTIQDQMKASAAGQQRLQERLDRHEQQRQLRASIHLGAQRARALPQATADTAVSIIQSVTALRAALPQASSIDDPIDQAYLQDAVQLLDRLHSDARAALVQPHLDSLRSLVTHAQMNERTCPASAYFSCLELTTVSLREEMLETPTQRAMHRSCQQELLALVSRLERALSPETRTAVRRLFDLRAAIDARLARLTGCDNAPFADLEAISQSVSELKLHLQTMPSVFADTQGWVSSIEGIEQGFVRPHQLNTFILKCMILIAKADGMVSDHEHNLLDQVSHRLSMTPSDLDAIIDATRSVNRPSYPITEDEGVRFISGLMDVACSDGTFSAKEQDLVKRILPILGVPESALPELYYDARRRYLKSNALAMGDASRISARTLAEIAEKTIRERHASGIRGLYLNPAADDKKLRHFITPESERVIAVFDATLLGSAKRGLVFTDKGLHWFLSPGEASGTLPYVEFRHASFESSGRSLAIVLPTARHQFALDVLGVSSQRLEILLADLGESIETYCATLWYICRDLQIVGPVTSDQLLQIANKGRVDLAADLLWSPARGEPARAADVLKKDSQSGGYGLAPEQDR